MRRALLPAVVLAITLTLAGCAPAQPELATDAAARLQQEVLAVSTASADGKLEDAVAALDQTEKELDAALAADEISPKRYREVRDAIRLVRGDLNDSIAAAKAKAEADAAAAEAQREAELAQQIQDLQNQQDQQAADDAGTDSGSDEGAEPPTGPGDKDKGKDDKGGGKDDGKGPGKGKGK